MTQGDLGHTDLQDDLEFHTSNFNENTPSANRKAPSSGLPLPATASTGGKRFLWSINFYAQFFDVDTSAVLQRCWAALFPRANFLDVLEGNPDLYGPFWIATTVVFILFLGGTISKYLATTGTEPFVYDFKLLSGTSIPTHASCGSRENIGTGCLLLSSTNTCDFLGAAGLVYGYTLFVPMALYLALRYFGSESANLLECWALYGYSNLIWVPVALISWSQISLLNWIFVGVGFGMSVAFLLRNLYPVLSATDKQTSKVLLVLVLVLHLALSVAIKMLFFAHGSLIENNQPNSGPDAGGVDDTPPAAADPAAGDPARMFMF